MTERPQQNSQPQRETSLTPSGSNPLSTEQGIPVEMSSLSKEPEKPVTVSPISKEPELKSEYGRSQLPKQISTGDTAVNLETDGEEEKPACKHHWIIESPHGATSMGRCINCNEEREFRNSIADGLWESDGAPKIFPD